MASLIDGDKLRPFTAAAIAKVMDRAARLVEDSERLSMELRRVGGLLREADYWAGQRKANLVDAKDVDQAITAQIRRSDRMRERMEEQTVRGIIHIDTTGEKVGQLNGLSVLSLGDYSFGKPSRITASVGLGKGEVVDIEREVALGGPLHSKGVLILQGFLAERYGAEQPLSLKASLVFEQSYGGVDGDSASSAELYALLSALAEAPIFQHFAVTGSVNQRGQVQAIGGVLLEHAIYDDRGNPLAATLKDYLVPLATDVPVIEFHPIHTPSVSLGGFKGVGEGGAIVGPSTLINAIADALSPFNIKCNEQPLSPSRLVAALEAARQG